MVKDFRAADKSVTPLVLDEFGIPEAAGVVVVVVVVVVEAVLVVVVVVVDVAVF